MKSSSLFSLIVDMVWEVIGGGILFLVILLFLFFFVRNNKPTLIFTNPVALGFIGIALLVELYLLYSLLRTIKQKRYRRTK